MSKLDLAASLQKLTRDQSDFMRLLEYAEFDVGLYRPAGRDLQTPHTRDELYVIAAGSGVFRCGDVNATFAPGDALFVAAGKEHRFEEFTPDFCAWGVFFGKRP